MPGLLTRAGVFDDCTRRQEPWVRLLVYLAISSQLVAPVVASRINDRVREHRQAARSAAVLEMLEAILNDSSSTTDVP